MDERKLLYIGGTAVIISFLILALTIIDDIDRIGEKHDSKPTYRIQAQTLYAPDDLMRFLDDGLHKGQTIDIKPLESVKDKP